MTWNGGLASSVYCLVASLFKNVCECAGKRKCKAETLNVFYSQKDINLCDHFGSCSSSSSSQVSLRVVWQFQNFEVSQSEAVVS